MSDPYEGLLRLVWQWVINYNDRSYDADDLISDLEREGHGCPIELEEN